MSLGLDVRPETSPPIGEALAGDAFEGLGGSLRILNIAVIVAKIEFAKIALEVLLADVLVHAVDAALQDAEIVLDRVGVPEATADVFLDRVIDRAVADELAAYLNVGTGFIGHKVAFAVDLSNQDRAQGLGIDGGDVERVHLAVAFHKSEHGFLFRWRAKGAVLGLAADKGFISLNNLVRTAQRAKVGVVTHGLADTVRHEPRRLVGDAQHAV